MPELTVTAQERQYLRDLARRYVEYASLPVQEERRRLWFAHNAFEPTPPPVVMELWTFWDDIAPPVRCTSPFAKGVERWLVEWITNHEIVGDDKVIPPFYPSGWQAGFTIFGIDITREYEKDCRGKDCGFKTHHPFATARETLAALKPSRMWVDRDASRAHRAALEELLGDILPVRFHGVRPFFCPAYHVFDLLGTENMMVAMMEEPEALRELVDRVAAELKAWCRWLEREDLLTPFDGHLQIGCGGYGFTRELPTRGTGPNGQALVRDQWLHLSAQEMTGVSPRVFHEIMYPAYAAVAAECGLVYYGCCEPVHEIWADSLSPLPNLRAVSISRWCDEAKMGAALQGRRTIYSRKPDPTLLSGAHFDEAAFAAHIARTLRATRGIARQFVFRDVYTLGGDRLRAGRATRIVREQIAQAAG